MGMKIRFLSFTRKCISWQFLHPLLSLFHCLFIVASRLSFTQRKCNNCWATTMQWWSNGASDKSSSELRILSKLEQFTRVLQLARIHQSLRTQVHLEVREYSDEGVDDVNVSSDWCITLLWLCFISLEPICLVSECAADAVLSEDIL